MLSTLAGHPEVGAELVDQRSLPFLHGASELIHGLLVDISTQKTCELRRRVHVGRDE